jgi:hypothetical protein
MRAPAVQDGCVISLSVADVSKTFKQVNIHKPMDYQDVYSEHALASDIFNLSLTQSVIPIYFKQSLCPRSTKVTWLNDYRPIALTSVAMKLFERL